MKGLLIVAVGGAAGSVARHGLTKWVLHNTIDWRFPMGTFLVNVVGCLAVGVLGGLVVKHDFFSPDARLLLFTGVAGGFTTFSAFGLETFYLIRRHEVVMAGGYILSSVVFGLLALWLGFLLISPRVP